MTPESVAPSVRCLTSPDEIDLRSVRIIETHCGAKRDPVGPCYGAILQCCFAVMLSLSCILCGCGGYVLNAASGELRLSPGAIAFGSVPVGKTLRSNVSLENRGTTTLSIGGLTISGQAFSLAGVTPMPFTLAPGASQVVAVTFAPSSQGDFTGQLTAVDGSNQNLASASITGQGMITVTPQLDVSVSTLNFGSTALNSTMTQSITLTSSGTGPVTVNSVGVSGTGFSIAGVSVPATLNPGQTLTIQVSFDPTVAGAASGTITISSNSTTGSTSMVSLSGTGVAAATPQLTISGNSLVFGSVTLNTASSKTLTLTSSGTAAVTVNSVGLAGAGFAIAGGSFPVVLNPGQTVMLQVSFDPTVAGAASGTLTISSNSTSGSTDMVGLSGTGVAGATPQLTVSGNSLAFGSVTLNTTSSKTLTLTSSGTAAVTVNSVGLAGAGFAIAGGSFPVVLNPGQTVMLQVSFDPTVAGAASGTLTISSNSTSGNTDMVSLSGTGTQALTPQLTVSASTLAFGSVTLNTASSKTLTLTSSGTAAVTVNSVGLAGAGFAIAGGSFPAVLNPGQTVMLQVSFDPTVAGAASGTITISSNSTSGSTNTVDLSGTGTQASTPQLTVSASTLAFGSVTLNTASSKTLTLTSSGTAAVTVNSVGLAGAGFAISGGSFPAVLNPGQTVMLQVSFDPTVAGAASGTITISSNSNSGSTNMVSLSGTGVAAATPQLTISGNLLAFGSVTLNTASSKTLTLTSSGTAAVTVNSVGLAGAGFAIAGGSFPAVLNPGQTVMLQVSFDPTVAGAASGTITISSDSTSGSTNMVSLSGTGTQASTPQLTVSASSLAFGSVTLNTTSTKTLTLTSSGTAAVTVNSVGLAGAGFAISGGSFPAVLNPGQTVMLQVSFDPTVAGAASGTITISSNSTSGSTNMVSLSGTGTQALTPQLTVSASTLAFGSVTLNTASTKTLTLTSSGTAAVTVNSVGLSGAGFAISGGSFPAVLNPGQTVMLQVSFDPTVAGAASGTITISSNSTSGSTNMVSLSGTGTSACHTTADGERQHSCLWQCDAEYGLEQDSDPDLVGNGGGDSQLCGSFRCRFCDFGRIVSGGVEPGANGDASGELRSHGGGSGQRNYHYFQ